MPGLNAPITYRPPAPLVNESAQNAFANLTRQQWADYVTQFVPYENKLIEYASDPATVSNAMNTASLNVNQAFDRQTDANSSRLQGLGLSLTPEEQAASTRSTGLARSLADVQAQNSARDAAMARQQSVIGNPAPRVGG